jgi:hypothetical protein
MVDEDDDSRRWRSKGADERVEGGRGRRVGSDSSSGNDNDNGSGSSTCDRATVDAISHALHQDDMPWYGMVWHGMA